MAKELSEKQKANIRMQKQKFNTMFKLIRLEKEAGVKPQYIDTAVHYGAGNKKAAEKHLNSMSWSR